MMQTLRIVVVDENHRLAGGGCRKPLEDKVVSTTARHRPDVELSVRSGWRSRDLQRPIMGAVGQKSPLQFGQQAEEIHCGVRCHGREKELILTPDMPGEDLA
jgi:hypothetical protein